MLSLARLYNCNMLLSADSWQSSEFAKLVEHCVEYRHWYHHLLNDLSLRRLLSLGFGGLGRFDETCFAFLNGTSACNDQLTYPLSARHSSQGLCMPLALIVFTHGWSDRSCAEFSETTPSLSGQIFAEVRDLCRQLPRRN